MNLKNTKIKKSEETIFFHNKNLGLIIFILFIVSFLSFEFGYFMGGLSFIPKEENIRANVSTYLAGLVTLLGLIMAFTFSMASERYQDRKHLLVEESNEIGTAYSYTSLLPEPIIETTRQLFRNYLDLRIQYSLIRDDVQQFLDIKNKLQSVHLKIWTLVAAEAKTSLNPIYIPIVMSLNSMRDTADKRNAAMDNRIPEPIIWLLLILSVLNMAAIGFGAGMVGHGNVIYAQIINLAICTTLYIIIDLDRPTKGIIKISHSSLFELKDSIGG
jgi:hypothetical protein